MRSFARLFGFIAGAVAACVAAPADTPAQDGRPLARFDAATDWHKARKMFAPLMPRAGRSATIDDDGVTLAVSGKNPGPFGMQAEATVTGDFQMDVRYELISFPDSPVDDGYGVIAGIYADAGAKYGSVKTGRSIYKTRGPSYHAARHVPAPTAKGMHYANSCSPATARHGRLGLRRVGSEMLYLAADTPDGELAEWTRYPFTDKPVRLLGVYAETGGAPTDLKVRLYDLQLRTGAEMPSAPRLAERPVSVIGRLPDHLAVPPPEPVGGATAAGLPGGGAAAPPAETAPPTPPVRGGFWVPVVTFLAGVAVGLAVGRLRRSAPRDPTRAAPKPTASRPPVTAPKPAAGKPRPPAV